MKEDSRVLATLDSDSNLKIFHLKDSLDLLQTITHGSTSINALCFCRGDQVLVSAGESGVKYFFAKNVTYIFF